MRFSTLILSVFLGLSSASAWAAGGHDHGHGHSHGPVNITEEQAKSIATYRVADLIHAREIDASWKAVSAEAAEQIATDGKSEWAVAFLSEDPVKPEEAKLLVFLSLTGEFVRTDFSEK